MPRCSRRNREQSLAVYLNNPSLTRDEFVEFLAAGFGLSSGAARSKTRCLAELTELLAQRHAAGDMTALIIDEAQCLPDELLEEVRLLANIESASEKLLSIILAGQPELADAPEPSVAAPVEAAHRPALLAAPLDAGRTSAYIAARVRIAGGDAVRLFTPEAVATIHERSRRHPAHDQRDLRQRAGVGFCARSRPIDRDIDSRGLRATSTSRSPRRSARRRYAPPHRPATARCRTAMSSPRRDAGEAPASRMNRRVACSRDWRRSAAMSRIPESTDRTRN